jgi:adenylate kinase
MLLPTKYQSIVLMGKIASGKSTQAKAVLETFGGTLYSNGNKVRETATLNTEFGVRVKRMYEGGFLMPEWIASYWMTHALLSEQPTDQIIFEAVAKKPHEAEIFHEIHTWMDRPYVAFNIAISDELVRARSVARARDAVDSPKSIEKRLEEYNTYTAQSIEFFREKGTLIEIDGSATIADVQAHIFSYLQS